ncbi:hypothetical protein G3O06_07620 [Burkholderia sp. Ac-20345]|uniref:hypothetical protein n=1 Tax=Burkholderia sp. Ac-20345 TaxID=2703891 RepID=UPI00197C85A7|nr:hypothetical protein [Burkholderia sp. Ac-20345]MBN3777418.1 hypothetical protein [Burkholderia sp. Ac-20345]
MSIDPKAWARRLVAEYETGQPTKPTNVYRVAYDALGKAFPEGGIVQVCSGDVQVSREPEQTASAPPAVQSRAAAIARPAWRASTPVPRHAPIENPWWDSTDRREDFA